MKTYCVLVLACAAVHFTVFAQQQSVAHPADTLAIYGSHIITGQDFLERFELMPWPLKDNKARIEYTKEEFLRSLVAEKVLALEAQRLGFGDDTTTGELQYTLQRMFTRDEVYKRDVVSKIRVTEAELRDGLRKYASELRVVLYGLVSKKEGDLLLRKMAASRNKEKTFEAFRDSLYTPLDTLTVNFGETEPVVENAAYALKVGALSQPLQADASHWVLVKVIDKTTNAKYAKQSMQDQLYSVRTIVSRRHEDSLASRTFSTLLSPQRAEADPVLFKELADSVLFVMKSDSANHYAKNLFHFTSDDCDRLERTFGAKVGKKLVMIESGDLTLGMVLNGLKYNQVVFPTLKPSVVQAIVNNNIKTVIQNELLAREGVKRNYQQSDNVRHDLAVWMDNRRGRLLMNAVADTVTVSDEEVQAYYANNASAFGAAVELKVREILVDSVSMALQLRKRIDAGENFASLASKYSKRTAWAARGGESEYFLSTKYPELGGYASSADSGKVIGPLRIPDGLTIFTVLDRRIHDDSIKSTLAAVKRNIRKKLLDEKKQQTWNKYIGGLAAKYNVSMNLANLRKTATTTTSMVTWRTIGFGGRILAVPMVMPQTEWVREMQSAKKINQ
jgi:parvulin-like peptidyl-prolyl isomerase